MEFPKYCQQYHGAFAEYFVEEAKTYLCKECFLLVVVYMEAEKSYTIKRLSPQNKIGKESGVLTKLS